MEPPVPSSNGCACGCHERAGARFHEVLAALRRDDLDRAIESGLLDCEPCAQCRPGCAITVEAARNDRVAALAARERYRRRIDRLEQRAAARAARRAPAADPPGDSSNDVASPAPALPPAAAAALARAQARAAAVRRKP